MLTAISIGIIIAIFASAVIRAYGWRDIKQRIKALMKSDVTKS